EGGHSSGTSGVQWVIDPLDGTTNYLYGYPVFAVSVAAEIDGRVAVGVVHDPSRGETFTATRGGGAFLNGTRLIVAGAPTLATALVGTGFSYVGARRAWEELRVDQLEVGHSLGQRHPDDLGRLEGDHRSEGALVDGFDRRHAKAGGQHAVEGGGCATPLDMTEDRHPRLEPGALLDLLG